MRGPLCKVSLWACGWIKFSLILKVSIYSCISLWNQIVSCDVNHCMSYASEAVFSISQMTSAASSASRSMKFDILYASNRRFLMPLFGQIHFLGHAGCLADRVLIYNTAISRALCTTTTAGAWLAMLVPKHFCASCRTRTELHEGSSWDQKKNCLGPRVPEQLRNLSCGGYLATESQMGYASRRIALFSDKPTASVG